ncbi:uncharacterized mitochondrial protein AtMg00810-like [Impatiens glandulifera]|uniref:uncharacterized mitochondrial protein AtMg00810-like n=1 Tax=Impatiens glandulifera TaxID=253017 RepID=UPI001FB0ED39|nr:uncharacterized mitochondrial protein AtMg00810-like [Impatiens glandulifera]
MSDLGLLSNYLGIEEDQKKDNIEVKQEAYTKKVLNSLQWRIVTRASILWKKILKLEKDVGGSLVNLKEYRRIIGCLRYLTHTRPDISYAVGIISRYMEKPTTLRQQAVK